MAQYNGNAVAKRFIINKQWGGAPARATIQFTESLPATTRSKIAVSIGAVTFHGIVKSIKQLTSESQGIDVTQITYEDIRTQTKWRWIKAAFNIKNDQGIFVHMRPEDWDNRVWKVFIEDSPGVFIFKDFSDYKESEDGLALSLTAEKIFEFILGELDTDGFNFEFEFSGAATTIIENCDPDDLNWLEGQTIYNAMVETSEKCKLRYTTTNFANRFRFDKIDVAQVVDFGADENIPSKSFGVSDTFTSQEVCILGDNDLHEISDIELVRNWNAKYEQYHLNYVRLDTDIATRDGNANKPPKFMPQAKPDGSAPDGIDHDWFDPDFGDPPATPEDRVLVTDYVLDNVFKNYRIPDEILILAGPSIGSRKTQELLPVNEDHGLISERSLIVRRPHKIAANVERPQIGNRKVPFILTEEFTEDYRLINKKRTITRPPKGIILFTKWIYRIKDGGLHLVNNKRNIADFIPDTPKLTAVFGVNRYTRIVGSGDVQTFHKVGGLFNEFIGAAQILNGADDFADEVGNLILSRITIVNTGTIKRVGTTIDLDAGIQSFQATLDGDSGVQQNLNLTDQNPPSQIASSRELDTGEVIKIEQEEPAVIINRREIPNARIEVKKGTPSLDSLPPVYSG